MMKSDTLANTKWSNLDIYDNTPKEVIVVHRDTLDNKLRDFELGISCKRELKHSFELILALLGVILTSNFKDFLGVPSSYWFAIFFLALIWALGKLCGDIISRFREQKYPTRGDVLNDLMAKTKKVENKKNLVDQSTRTSEKFLIQEEGKNEVYLVESGIKRHIPDPETLSKLGYSWSEIKKVTVMDASKYKLGSPLSSQK